MICSWLENPSEKKGKRFTNFFFVNHFPKHAWGSSPSFHAFDLSLCSLGPICFVEPAFLLRGRALHGVGPARTDQSGTVSRLCDWRRPRFGPDEAGKIVPKVRKDPNTESFKPSRWLSLLVDLWWPVVGCGVGCGGWQGWVSVCCGGWQWWFLFLVDSSGFGWGFFLLFCFTLLQTHNVEYFSKYFPIMQTNTEKKLFSPKSFAFENILQYKMF